MKLITELDEIEFMRALYQSADIVNECLDVTNIMDIRKRQPENLPKILDTDGPLVKGEKLIVIDKLWKKQAKANVMDMLNELFNKHPEYAIKLFRSLIVLEEGEEYPKGLKLFNYALTAFLNEDVLDFFSTLMRLEQAYTSDI